MNEKACPKDCSNVGQWSFEKARPKDCSILSVLKTFKQAKFFMPCSYRLAQKEQLQEVMGSQRYSCHTIEGDARWRRPKPGARLNVTYHMVKPTIPQYSFILFSCYFNSQYSKTTKQTPYKNQIFISVFIFLLAILRFVFEFSQFHSHSLRDRPRGELTVAINGQCTC